MQEWTRNGMSLPWHCSCNCLNLLTKNIVPHLSQWPFDKYSVGSNLDEASVEKKSLGLEL